MMTKKDFKQFADALAEYADEARREHLIERFCLIFKANNPRFDESRFREWIRRKVAGESTKGLR